MAMLVPTTVYTFPTLTVPPTTGGTVSVKHDGYFRYVRFTGNPTDGFGNVAKLAFYDVSEKATSVNETTSKASKAVAKGGMLSVYIYRPIVQTNTVSLFGMDGKLIKKCRLPSLL